MPAPIRKSAAEQVAAHLRTEITGGRWTGTMPGQIRLAVEFGVARNTVEAALRQLEREGLLVNDGPGRRRRIAPLSGGAAHPLKVGMLLMETDDRRAAMFAELRRLLEQAGHLPFYGEKTLLSLGMHADRVAKFVRACEAEAWIVNAASRSVLEWFCRERVPAFALFGRFEGLPIAATGPMFAPVFAEAVHRLAALGHRRISLLIRRQHREPSPGHTAGAFLDALAAHGIRPGKFNLPDWEETKEGFQKVLTALFSHTPPTALVLDEAFLYWAAREFLARRGLRVPEDVSLVCTEASTKFEWSEPSVAHMTFDYLPLLRRVVRWAGGVSRGVREFRQHRFRARFVDGGSVGPVPGF